jgi:dephospho-CoA kinase
MYRIGLTGGIGSGKSEAARVLAGLGAVVVTADELARRLVEPGSPVLARIVDAFGGGVLRGDGTLDRKRLASLAFGDAANLALLNEVTHPPLVAAIIERLEALDRERGEGVAVVDAALLTEWDVTDLFDLVLLIAAPVEVRVARLVDAGYAEADARARIEAQLPEERLREVADHVIENAGTLEELRRTVVALWRTLPPNTGGTSDERDQA